MQGRQKGKSEPEATEDELLAVLEDEANDE
jgi:hypothetical protein